jgi:hypothetical protein
MNRGALGRLGKMTNRTGLLVASVCFLLLCGKAGAADITTTGGLTYQDASITEVTDTVVKFQMKSGAIIIKAIQDIK